MLFPDSQLAYFCGLVVSSKTWIIFITRHTIAVGYYGFTLDVRVCLSVRPSVSHTSVRPFFVSMITWANIKGFLPNLVCALILWRSGLGLLMGKFRQIFTELSARDTIMAGYYSLTFLFAIVHKAVDFVTVVTFWHIDYRLKRGLLHKERMCSLRDQIRSF